MTKNKTCITKNFYLFLTLSLAALLSTTLWSAQRKPDQAAPGHVIVEIKKADIRSAPNPASTIAEIAFKGEIFKVLHELPEWYLIELSSGKEGYLAKKYARPKILNRSKKAQALIPKPAPVNKEVTEKYVLIISSGSYIRAIPRANGKIVAKAKIDNAFKLSKKVSAAWYEIALANGQICYIPASIAKIITPAELTQFKAQRKPAAVPKAAPQPKPEPVVAPQPEPKSQPALQPSYVVAMKNDIILRQEPDITAKIMVTAKQGDHYKLLSQEGVWCTVLLPDDRQAYVLSKVIRIVNEPDLPAAISEATKAAKQIKLRTVSVTDKSANLRAKASDSAKVISTASQGAIFKLVWVYKDWYEVLTSSGTAFISDKSAKLITDEDSEAKTAAVAVAAPEVPAPPVPDQPKEKPTPTEKPAEHDEDNWLKDKYVLITTNMVNLREAANIKSRILARANTGKTYKLLARHNDWYEIFFPPDQNAFVAASLTAILTEADVLAGPKKQEQINKERQATELKAKQLRAAEALVKRKEAASLAAEAKIRAEAERKLRLEKQEAEAKAREQEWLKDKYVLITVKKAVLQKEPNIKAKILGKLDIGDSYKLVSRRKDWYEINFSTGTAFVNHNLGTILSETALAEHKQKAAEEKARREAEQKAKLENERKVREESKRRAKEAAELKVREEAERKLLLEKQEAEARSLEQEWLKDKYVVINKKNINLRKAPSRTAPVIAQTKTGESFKLVSRSKAWYEVSMSSGTAFVANSLAEVLSDKELKAKRAFERAAAEEKADQLREAKELKEQQEAETKAKDEAWCKDKYAVIMGTNANLRAEPSLKGKVLANAKKEDIFKLIARGKDWYEIFLPPDQNAFVSIGLIDLLTEGEVESRIRKEREPILRKQREAEEKALKLRAAEELKARQEAELKARLENEKKIREESEAKAKAEAELKAKEFREAAELAKRQEAEAKAKEIEWLKDKYILVKKKTDFHPAPNKKAAASGTAIPDDSYKIVTRTNEWYGVDTSSGTAFIPIDRVKLLTEQELNAYRQQQELLRQEKLQKEAKEKTRKEAELKAKIEAERKAKELRETAELAKRQETERLARLAEEEKARKEAEAIAKIESLVHDKYILIQTDNTNLRSAPKKSSPIITRVKSGEYFKLMWIEEDEDNSQWYQVNVPSGKQNIKAYIHSSLAKPLTKTELDTILRQYTPEAPAQEAVPPAKTTAEKPTQEQLSATETEWLKDKYVLITINNTNVRQAASINASIIDKAKIASTYKLTARAKDWYEINTSSGTAFVNAGVTKIITKIELAAMREQQEKERELRAAAELKERQEAEELKVRQEAEKKARLEAERQAREEKLRLEAEAKVREEAERKLRLEKREAERLAKELREATELAKRQEAERKAKELRAAAELKERQEAEQKKQEAAELKAKQEAERKLQLEKQEAEAKALEEEWLKDKYAVAQYKNTNIRKAPGKNAEIVQKAQAGQDFKIVSRGREWYEIALIAGTAYIHNTVVKVFSDTELTALKQQQEAEKVRQQRAAEELKAHQEAERKAKEFREATELAKRQEAEQKKREAAELKAKQEAEVKAIEQEWIKDKYVMITINNTNLRQAPSRTANIVLKTNAGEFFKLKARGKEWHELLIPPDQTVFVFASLVQVMSETEVQAKAEAERQAREEKLRLEAEAKAQREAERLAKELRAAAELKERQKAEQKKQEAAELKAKQEADEKIRIETYIKDKYILTLLDNTNLRTAPDKNSSIVTKVNSDVSFKVIWITPDKQNVPWYQVSVPIGTTTVPAYIITTLAKLVTVQELNDHRLAQQKTAEEKARLEAEAKAQREAERLAKEFREATELAKRQEAERKAKELRAAAELKERQEAEQKKQEAAELKAKQEAERKLQLEKQEAEAKALEEEWLKDKYVVAQYKDTNIRKAPSKNAEIVQKAQAGQDFKIVSRGKEWYKIILTAGTAYIHNTVVKVFSGTELTSLRQQEEEAHLEKLKKEAEEKALKEAQIIARLEAEQKAREEKMRLEAEQNAKAAAELKARQEAEEKARLEAERKAKEVAEIKARIEAEAKTKMEAYVKDKYIVISDNNAVVRTAPNIRASVLHVAEENETFKLNWIRDNWYEIKVPSGTAIVMGFVDVSAARSMTMKELAAWQKAQEQERSLREARELKARQQAELKAKEEAAAKRAQLEAERLAKLEAEEKAREEAERKAREEAEAKTLEEEWLKDKHAVAQYKDTNIRKAPSKNAEIVQKTQAGQDFKIVSRGREWYEIALAAGTAYIHNTVVKVLSGTELAALRQAQEAEQKAKLETERIAKIAEQKAKEDAELKAKIMAEAKSKKEVEEKAAKAADQKAQQEEKARLEAGQKVKEVEQKAKVEEREDLAEYGYVVINAPYAEIKIIPDTGAQALLISLKGDVFKYNGQQKGWYHVLTFSGETRFVRKSQCRGSNTAPQLPAKESTRQDIYDIIIDAKDRAMSETNAKYPSVKSQSELQEKIFYQQTVEEKLILEIFHKYKIQPATYLTLLSEAISKNW